MKFDSAPYLSKFIRANYLIRDLLCMSVSEKTLKYRVKSYIHETLLLKGLLWFFTIKFYNSIYYNRFHSTGKY